MLSYKKYKDERAMTGAKERVIKAFVAIKSTYKDIELEKPFVFPRIILDSEKMLANLETRNAALAKITGVTSAIFGEARNMLKEDPGVLDVAFTHHEEPSENTIHENPVHITEPVNFNK